MHNEAWTPETDALIARLRADERLSAKAIAAQVGRTPAATSARLLKLGVRIHTREEWGVGEVEDLRRLLDDRSLSVRAVARALGRTECSVRWKVEDLGLRPERLRSWTPADDARALAAAGAGNRALRALADGMGRSYDALRARQAALGHRTRWAWDAKDVEALRALAAEGATLASAAAAIGKPAGAVRAKGYTLGVRFAPAPTASAAWDEAADAALLRHDGTAAGLGRLMDALGRTERAVRTRLRVLGVVAVVRPVRVREVREPRPAVRSAPAARPVRPVLPAAPRPTPQAPRVAASSVSRYLPSRVRATGAPEAARLRAGMDDAIALFMRERGVSRGTGDPAEDVVRRVRARGYSVTGGVAGGFVVDARLAVPDLDGLRAFARARGIVLDVVALVPAE
jgi:hypothetical protein